MSPARPADQTNCVTTIQYIIYYTTMNTAVNHTRTILLILYRRVATVVNNQLVESRAYNRCAVKTARVENISGRQVGNVYNIICVCLEVSATHVQL